AASADSGATVEYRANSDEVADPANITLNEGMNVIQAVCTAGDGTTTETYTLNVIRQVANDSVFLAGLAIEGASFDVPFDKDTTVYNVNLASSMSPINLTAQAESVTATVEVKLNGVVVNPLAIALVEGNHLITVTVMNGAASKEYSIIANVTTASSNAKLKSLKVGVGTISTRPIHPGTFVRDATYHNPASVSFSKTQYDYVTVIYGFNQMKVTAAVDDSSAMDVQFAVASSGPGAHGSVATQSYTGGTATATINLEAGYVSQVDITVTAASGATQVYRLYVKLLNADEFYWGIYGPSMDASKNRWTKPQPGTYNGTGLVSGTVNWVVTTAPVSTITLTNYNDGDLGFLYNNGGFVANGAHRAELASITNKDGWDLTHNPPFLIRTASSETVAELDYHLWIDDSDPAVLRGATLETSSYTGIKYLGATTWHIQYYSASPKPYPFTSSYDWFTPWSDGQ
ncbi:MAG TPA: cadherin-like beta sandwich domain-containing protein, partial [Spirochaetota bacterium]|nr:cadherin-like beta sandwich domain-containing protein [Spirochaetota bacterium]